MDSIIDNEILREANNTLAAWVKKLRDENAKLKIKARRLGIKLFDKRLELKGVRGTQALAIGELQSEREKTKQLEKVLEKHK